MNGRALWPDGDNILLNVVGLNRDQTEARVCTAKARRKRARTHLNQVTPRCAHRMREGIVDMPSQHSVYMRRSAAV